jgi:hypothetical protein
MIGRKGIGFEFAGGSGISDGERSTFEYLASSNFAASDLISGCVWRIWFKIPVLLKLCVHCVQTRILYPMKNATAVSLSQITLYP